jgi:hypothetical protein
MQTLQTLLEEKHDTWYAHYSWRPGKLFDTVNRALTIFVLAPSASDKRQTFSTQYQKWTADTRSLLMVTMNYVEVPSQRTAFWIPKLGHAIEKSILEKYLTIHSRGEHMLGKSNFRIYYRTTGGLYWKVFTDVAPAFRVNGEEGHSTRETWLTLKDETLVRSGIAILSSNVFWWWYTITTNCRDLNPSDIQQFPIPASALADVRLDEIGAKYLADVMKNSTMLLRIQKQTGRTETQSFKIQKSKPILDEIDRVLAQYYGFTDEELDFISNYDIKYRMGRESGSEEEE